MRVRELAKKKDLFAPPAERDFARNSDSSSGGLSDLGFALLGWFVGIIHFHFMIQTKLPLFLPLEAPYIFPEFG